MAYYRAQILINQTSQAPNKPPCGWSEKYDFQASSDAIAFNATTKLGTRRLAFLGSNYYAIGVRCSTVVAQALKSPAVGYRLHLNSLQICGWGVNKPGQASVGMDPYSALFYRAYASGAPGKPSVRKFRGIPSAWWTALGNPAVGPIEGELQAWFQYLKSWGWVKLYGYKTTGTILSAPFTCLEFERFAVKRTGRPFGLVRAKRYSHHGKPS